MSWSLTNAGALPVDNASQPGLRNDRDSPDAYLSFFSQSGGSESLGEALAFSPGSSVRSVPANVIAPWDDLAGSFWNLWDEMETDLYRGVSESRIPPKDLRDELVALFFRHVHPLCPVFDEVEFHSKYYHGGDDLSFLECVSLLEFQAMMFAASLHLNGSQICKTQYSSTDHCHNSLFEIAKNTYNACQDASPIVLTRTALLLSYWSPYSSETQTNNYWVDEAFLNAQVARLPEPDHGPKALPPGRRKLIWWCCLLRDRLIAFGLKRAQRLHEEPWTCELACVEDFGLEAVSPRFMDKSSKLRSIDNFIRQCELSRVIARIMQFQTRRGCKEHGNNEDMDVEEFLEVTSLHTQLTEWRTSFEASHEDRLDELPSGSGSCNMPCQMTQIFCDSAVTALYLPYTSINTINCNPLVNEFSENALNHVKNASSQIARRIERLSCKIDSNDIPLALGAWIMFPIAVKLVFIRNSADLDDPAADLQEMRSLMNVLYIMKHRFSGGLFVSNVLDAVISHIFLAGCKDSRQDLTGLVKDAADIIETCLKEAIIPSAKL